MAKFQVICPSCGAFGSPEIFLTEAIKRDAIAKALRLPHPLALQIQIYIGMFRSPARGHSIDRVEKLLTELLEPIEAGYIKRHGRKWPAPVEVWGYALDQVILKRDALRLPLKDHNYLFEVISGQSNRIEADAEKKHHEQLKHKSRDTRDDKLPDGYDAAKRAKRQMQDMQEKIDQRKAEEANREK